MTTDFRRCSTHDIALVLKNCDGLLLWRCSIPGCQRARSCKAGRRNLKSRPSKIILGLADKIRMRDRAQSQRASARVR